MLEETASAIPTSIWSSMNSWFTPTVLFVLLNLMIGTIAFTSSLANHKQHPQNQHNNQNDPHQQPSIAASSPSVLQRLKSINFHRSQQESQTSSLHHEQNPDSETLFSIERTHLETQSHDYFFRDTSPENLETDPQTQAHYVFEQTHQNTEPETQTPFEFEVNDSSFDGFQEAREEKVEENEQDIDEVYTQVTGSHFGRTKSDTEPTSGEIPAKLPAKMRKSASLKSPFGHFEEEDIVEALRPATVREKGSAKMTDGDEEVDAKADVFINRFKQQLKLQRLDSIVRYKDMIGRASGGR